MKKNFAAVVFRIGVVMCVLTLGSGLLFGGTITIPLGNLISSEPIEQGNLIFSNFSLSASWATSGMLTGPNAWQAEFIELSPTKYNLTITWNGTNSVPLPQGTYTFGYTVLVDSSSPITTAGEGIVNVRVDQITNGNDNSNVLKTVTPGGTIQIPAGTYPDNISLPYLTSISIFETVTVGNSNDYEEFTDQFNEGSTPEPATMALMGAGLLGLGALLRRKKRA